MLDHGNSAMQTIQFCKQFYNKITSYLYQRIRGDMELIYSTLKKGRLEK